MFGFLNLDKPAGMTSRDVVNRVQRLIKPEKVGHAGTLDPLATGVLVVAVGAATRCIAYVQQQPKQYTGQFLLGRTSDTEDTEGEVVMLESPPQPTAAEVAAQLPTLIGQIEQRPPAYSALKVAGRRAYDLARAGQEVELAARPIMVYDLQLREYDYPRLTLDITCGSGTYVRSLGRDLAEQLGTGAVMSALVRTRIGPYCLEEAVAPGELTRENLPQKLRPATEALAALPTVTLSEDEIEEIRHGRLISRPPELSADATELLGVDATGTLIAILSPREEGQLRPTRNFVHLR